MKKHISIIFLFCIVMLVSSSSSHGALNENDVNLEEVHKHSFSEWVVLTPASCISDGQRGRICCSCGFSEFSEIEAKSHAIVIDPEIFPTCTADGKSEGKHCSNCGETIVAQTAISKLEHSPIIDPAVSPTCTKEGKSEGVHCGKCETILIEQSILEPLGHQYDQGQVVDKATFWKQGKVKFTCMCENCNFSYYEAFSTTTITTLAIDVQPTSSKLYSFCAISDIHLTYETATEDFQRALSYAEENCDFTCVAGDLTSTGKESELQAYKRIVDEFSPSKPVYAIAGNHENYSTISQNYLQEYINQPLYYSFEVGNDVYIMLGHYGGYRGDGIGWKSDELLSIDEIQWLYEILEVNRNKRCFIFSHVLPHEHGVGNPNGVYTVAPIWKTNDNGIGEALINLLRHYKNVILFHGHSHTCFALQELNATANCSDNHGYRSVHIPSLSVPRDFVNGVLTYIYAESEGYIIDVYEDHIILKGRDFVDNAADGHWIPNATYKIDTQLFTIEENTFIDNTGIITQK